MKKVISVALVVMMLLSSMAVGSFALSNSSSVTDLYLSLRASQVITSEQVILSFDLAGGTVLEEVEVYDETEGFVRKTGVTGIYNKIPNNKDQYTTNGQTPGRRVILPNVVPPTGKTFDGWYCYGVDEIIPAGHYAAGSYYTIPEGAQHHGVIEFIALMSPAPVEESILDTLLGVFGMVIGALAEMLGIKLPEDFDLAELLGGLF